MQSRNNLAIVLILLFNANSALANDPAVFRDQIFTASVRTVQLYVNPLPLSDAVIPLNGPSQLHLAFDDLEGDKKNYFYTLILCNYDWTPSDLNPFGYLEGFQQQEIITFSFSFNTYQHFTHYDLQFPNADIRITKSGNYVLKVYADNDPGKVVLTRRFIVFESNLQVITDVHQPLSAKYSRTHQEVDFSLNYSGMSISNPQNDIHVLLMQNFRWDNAISNLSPLFQRSNQLDYNYEMENAFEAGKEFRNFDTRTIRYRTEHVKEIKTSNDVTDILLFSDEVRAGTPYFFRRDIDGKFLPATQDYPEEALQADYVWVYFTLPFDYPVKEGKIYLFGKFTDWQLLPDFQMQWNPKLFAYEAKAYLKQGYYEYEYIYSDNNGNAETDLIEGNSYETQNTYQVFVYYRPFGARYDQVIAYKATDSFNK
ncbi:MAG: DUF5103 domain-containing protein [Chitinophagales bacterium]|nr:DUF5103 domain-containing protein [Chitinophagales bacterium]